MKHEVIRLAGVRADEVLSELLNILKQQLVTVVWTRCPELRHLLAQMHKQQASPNSTQPGDDLGKVTQSVVRFLSSETASVTAPFWASASNLAE